MDRTFTICFRNINKTQQVIWKANLMFSAYVYFCNKLINLGALLFIQLILVKLWAISYKYTHVERHSETEIVYLYERHKAFTLIYAPEARTEFWMWNTSLDTAFCFDEHIKHIILECFWKHQILQYLSWRNRFYNILDLEGKPFEYYIDICIWT